MPVKATGKSVERNTEDVENRNGPAPQPGGGMDAHEGAYQYQLRCSSTLFHCPKNGKFTGVAEVAYASWSSVQPLLICEYLMMYENVIKVEPAYPKSCSSSDFKPDLKPLPTALRKIRFYGSMLHQMLPASQDPCLFYSNMTAEDLFLACQQFRTANAILRNDDEELGWKAMQPWVDDASAEMGFALFE